MTEAEEKRPLHNAPARLRKVTEKKTLRRAPEKRKGSGGAFSDDGRRFVSE